MTSYCTIGFVRGLLILLMAAIAWAQPPTTIFPSDSKDPKQSGGAALLEAVCPGRVSVGEKIRCQMDCPAFTGLSDLDDWTLSSVTRGHFLSAQSEDAALAMTGCEPHSENWGGTILLSRGAQTWKMLWYKAGVVTEQCHKVKLRDGREILVCMGSAGGQGVMRTELYLVDLRSPTPTLMAADHDGFF